MAVGTILKSRRQATGKTIKELADEFNVSPMTISRLESGKQEVLSKSMIGKLCMFLTEEDFELLDKTHPQECKLLDYHLELEKKDKERSKNIAKKDIVSEEKVVLKFVDILASKKNLSDFNALCEEHDFYSSDYNPDCSQYYNSQKEAELSEFYTPYAIDPCERIYADETPWWFVSAFYALDVAENAEAITDFSEYIKSNLFDTIQAVSGFVFTHEEIKKLSFCVPEHVVGVFSKALRGVLSRSRVFPCDLSVLGYSRSSKGMSFCEIDLVLQSNNAGAYDLESQVGTFEFADWKKALLSTIPEQQ